jgi:hypothetical protein
MSTPQQVSAQYHDVKPVLDQCLAHGGGTYEAPSAGSAVQFRHRCYSFRKAYRDAIAPGASPYDKLILRKLAKGETRVVIEPNTLPGTFTPASGARVDEPEVAPDDPLLEEARALRESLGLDLE